MSHRGIVLYEAPAALTDLRRKNVAHDQNILSGLAARDCAATRSRTLKASETQRPPPSI